MNDFSPLISVIIPVYNTYDYVKRGIDSVLSQTYKSIELIMVDDGSTDGSKELLDHIHEINPQIIVVHQNNSGVSVARNRGLDLISGKYVCFLDSDDWLTDDAIEFLYEQIKEKDKTVSACDRNFVEIKNGNLEVKRQRDSEAPIYLSATQALLETGTVKLNLQSACYKLFPVSLINGKEHIRFNEEISHGEDGLFVFDILCRAEGIVFSPEPKWNILTRPGSATTSDFSSRMLTALWAVDKMISEAGNNTELINRLKIYYTERAMGLTVKYSISKYKSKNDKKLLRSALKRYKGIFINSNVSVIKKFKYYFLLYMPSKTVYLTFNFNKTIGG